MRRRLILALFTLTAAVGLAGVPLATHATAQHATQQAGGWCADVGAGNRPPWATVCTP